MQDSLNDRPDHPFPFGAPLKAVKRTIEPAAPMMPARVQPPLSVTEKAVLKLLMRGMTERAAAEELGRSPNTVHVHVRNIYRKLGVSSRKMLFKLVDSQPELLIDDEPKNAAA